MASLLNAPDPYERIQALQQIIGILIARTGEQQIEIGEVELAAIPTHMTLTTWRSPLAFTHIVCTDVPMSVVEEIKRFGDDLAAWDAAHPTDDVVDAEIVEDAELTTGQRAITAAA
ncbi:MAG TPA: hypothetical protein VGG83_10860 [Trebonia sp.]